MTRPKSPRAETENPDAKSTGVMPRKERLKQALRENLRRRKTRSSRKSGTEGERS